MDREAGGDPAGRQLMYMNSLLRVLGLEKSNWR